MPVFNSAAYLREAIESVLEQTFADFELIIINDGSLDESEKIIQSYSDNRIRYIKNERNEGLVYTLNRGIQAANGVWIARMDGDDISCPERFEKQVAFLKKHPEVKMLSTTARLINEAGAVTGVWQEDVKHITPEQIRKRLPFDNCIVHPAVMGSTEIFRKYGYNMAQKQAEDYDLWLRIVADGVAIHKIAEPLLLHRILPESFTRASKKNVFWKNARTKLVFFKQKLAVTKLNFFILKVALVGILDIFKGYGKILKKNIAGN